MGIGAIVEITAEDGVISGIGSEVRVWGRGRDGEEGWGGGDSTIGERLGGHFGKIEHSLSEGSFEGHGCRAHLGIWELGYSKS